MCILHHRTRIKWHTFPATECRLRSAWVAEGFPANGPSTGAARAAAATDDATADTADSSLTEPATSDDVTALLASAMSLASDNNVAKDLIAEALNAIHHADGYATV